MALGYADADLIDICLTKSLFTAYIECQARLRAWFRQHTSWVKQGTRQAKAEKRKTSAGHDHWLMQPDCS
jgi:hypothetical protein